MTEITFPRGLNGIAVDETRICMPDKQTDGLCYRGFAIEELAAVEDMKKFLVVEFGADVNLANVMPQEILETEALRVGLGVVGPPVKKPHRFPRAATGRRP